MTNEQNTPLPLEDRYYEISDPKRYEKSLDLVEQFENLPDERKSLVARRITQLYYGSKPDGSDGMGDVEAVALAMTELNDQNPATSSNPTQQP